MSNSIENKFQIVKQLLEDGRRQEATIYLAKILRQDPTNVYAWYLFGHALDDEAKKVYAFERVIKLDPSHKGAINQLERLREEPPGPPPLSQEKDLKRAEALLQSGQREGARASLVTILRRNPKNEHAWYLLGLALDSPPQKVYAFERVKRLNPSHQKAGQQLRRLGTKHHLRSRPEKHTTASTPELPSAVGLK
jgi:ferric-dicitrate binding protein FerR (iron transport regulator)